MAEVVGAISGAITIGALAANVAMSVSKLKSYWDQLEDTPEDVRRLIEEIEILSLILDDVDQDQALNPISGLLLDGTSSSRCLEHCNKAADRLRRLTDDMGNCINTSHQLKRKWASAKVLLKKDKIDKFKLELEGAIRLLSLSHQSYMRALLRLQPEIIFARVSQAMAPKATLNLSRPEDYGQASPMVAPSPEPKNPKQNYSCRKSHQSSWQIMGTCKTLGSLGFKTKTYTIKDHQEVGNPDHIPKHDEIVAWYRGPAWLINRAWEFHATGTYNGWDFKIRQYNIIPRDSMVFIYARAGNVSGLHEIFAKRQASAFDCDKYGWTPLHHAAVFGRYAVCKLLFDMGADANYQLGRGLYSTRSPIEATICNTAIICSAGGNQDWLETPRLLLSRAETDPDSISEYRGPVEGFTTWQKYIDPQYYDRALQERMAMVRKLSAINFGIEPLLFRKALVLGDIPQSAVGIRGEGGDTLLHVVTEAIRTSNSHECEFRNLEPNRLGAESLKQNLAGWPLILQELVQKGAHLHAVNHSHHTPLIALLRSGSRKWGRGETSPWTSLLNTWIGGLWECGADLEEYGQREQELHQNGLSTWDFEFLRRRDGRYVREMMCLESFTYGSTPTDWDFVIKPYVKELDEDLGQRETIPGSWVEA